MKVLVTETRKMLATDLAVEVVREIDVEDLAGVPGQDGPPPPGRSEGKQ